MYNNTLNEDDYKEAVRSKYEEVKNGIYSNYLNSPSQANLRELCWKIFKSDNITIDDLSVYNDFFKFEFDSNNDDISTSYTDKFKKVGRFFRGETKPARIDTVNLAAILVGFELRPYIKFKKLALVQAGKVSEDKFEEIISNLITEAKSEAEIVKGEKSLEENKSFDKEEISNKVENLQEDEVLPEAEAPKENTESISLFVNVDEAVQVPPKESGNKRDNLKIFITIGITFCLMIVVYYCFVKKKDCMQWSDNHYDEVSCELEVQGAGTFNSPETYDERIINLRRIQVCDTTTFFINNKAVVWYAKVGDNAEFFNTHGMHPENGKALRPVTHYIINKYVKNHCK
jgi:hypothetical protein